MTRSSSEASGTSAEPGHEQARAERAAWRLGEVCYAVSEQQSSAPQESGHQPPESCRLGPRHKLCGLPEGEALGGQDPADWLEAWAYEGRSQSSGRPPSQDTFPASPIPSHLKV